MQKIVVLTGAGMSADSGLKTFRDADGLWEGHDVMKVASPQGFSRNPELVLDFYNQRRRQLKEAEPNPGHLALVELESVYDVSIITQNVDNLHERAGSSHVIHLHGELFKVRSTGNPHDVKEWKDDIFVGDLCEQGHQLRPHIVWFGEDVPLLPHAAQLTQQADLLIVIGTSMQVYPASSLIHYTRTGVRKFFVDPNPTISAYQYDDLDIIAERAAIGVPTLVADLVGRASGF